MLQKKCVNLKKVSNKNVKTNQEVCFFTQIIHLWHFFTTLLHILNTFVLRDKIQQSKVGSFWVLRL